MIISKVINMKSYIDDLVDFGLENCKTFYKEKNTISEDVLKLGYDDNLDYWCDEALREASKTHNYERVTLKFLDLFSSFCSKYYKYQYNVITLDKSKVLITFINFR